MPPLSAEARKVDLPAESKVLSARGSNALVGLMRAPEAAPACRARRAGPLFVSLIPALALGAILALTFLVATAPEEKSDTTALTINTGMSGADEQTTTGGLAAPEGSEEEEKPRSPWRPGRRG
jgi:hypothetical protein